MILVPLALFCPPTDGDGHTYGRSDRDRSSVPEVVLLGHLDSQPARALQHLGPLVVGAEPLVKGHVDGKGVEGHPRGVADELVTPRLFVVEKGDGEAGRHFDHIDVRRVGRIEGRRAHEEGHGGAVVQPRRPGALVLAEQNTCKWGVENWRNCRSLFSPFHGDRISPISTHLAQSSPACSQCPSRVSGEPRTCS